VVTQFTHFSTAQSQLALSGAFSLTIFGAIYFLVPRITGQAWPSLSLIRAHFFAVLVGTVVLVATLAVAGWIQGHELNDPAVTFAAIGAHTKPWLLIATSAQLVLLVGNLLLLVHFLRALAGICCKADTPATFRQPPTMEASVS